VVVRIRDSRPILARHGTTISTLCLRCAPILVPIRADAKSTQGSKLEADISMGCRVPAVYRDMLDYIYIIVSNRVGRLTIPVRPLVATPAALASARPVSCSCCSSCSTPCQSRTRAGRRRHVGVQQALEVVFNAVDNRGTRRRSDAVHTKTPKRLDGCTTVLVQCCVPGRSMLGTLDAGGLSESVRRGRKTAAIASCEGDRTGSLVGRLPLAASTFRGDGAPAFEGGSAGVGGAWSMCRCVDVVST
jgi:hypothetical protein